MVVPLCIISAARVENGSNVDADLAAAEEDGSSGISTYFCGRCRLFTDCGGKCGKTFKFEDLADFAAPGAGADLTYRKMQPAEIVALDCGEGDWCGRERRWCRACQDKHRRPQLVLRRPPAAGGTEDIAAAAAIQPTCRIDERICRARLAHAKKLQRSKGAAKAFLQAAGPAFNLRNLDRQELEFANSTWLWKAVGGGDLEN